MAFFAYATNYLIDLKHAVIMIIQPGSNLAKSRPRKGETGSARLFASMFGTAKAGSCSRIVDCEVLEVDPAKRLSYRWDAGKDLRP